MAYSVMDSLSFPANAYKNELQKQNSSGYEQQPLDFCKSFKEIWLHWKRKNKNLSSPFVTSNNPAGLKAKVHTFQANVRTACGCLENHC